MQTMSFGDETGDYSSIYTVDSKKFNNKLNIENIGEGTYAEIGKESAEIEIKEKQCLATEMSNNSRTDHSPVYALVDLKKKQQARREKFFKESNNSEEKPNVDLKAEATIYEDVGTEEAREERVKSKEESHIYELVSSLEDVYNEVKDNCDNDIYTEIWIVW